MKKIILNIISFLTAVIFLISTSGFTIYGHHCCHDEISYSVVIENTDHDGAEFDCNQLKDINSCCYEKYSCSTKTEQNYGSCNNFEQFVIADITLAGTISINTLEIQSIDLLNILSSKKYNCSDELTDHIYDNQVINHPNQIPKLSRVIFFNTLKILPDPFS